MSEMEEFELGWLGGAAERHFRKTRKGVDDLPWGTLRPGDYPDVLVDRARAAWTESTFNEYCTAAAFAEVLSAMLAARAPIDLVGMAGDFVADEMVHVELNARMAMELGGAAPMIVDFTKLAPEMSARDLSPLQRANELVVRTCCVGEAFSVPMLASILRATEHPLTHAVMERIVQDEAPHARLGSLYLEWVESLLDDVERTRLAGVALEAIDGYRELFRAPTEASPFRIEDVHALGWMEASAYAKAARRAVREDVVAPLERFGIVIAPQKLEAIFE